MHVLGDIHPADVMAALRKKGLTMSQLSRELGNHPTLVSSVVYGNRSARTERAIAAKLNTTPEVLWPSRWYADGTPRYPAPKSRTRKRRRNTQSGRAA